MNDFAKDANDPPELLEGPGSGSCRAVLEESSPGCSEYGGGWSSSKPPGFGCENCEEGAVLFTGVFSELLLCESILDASDALLNTLAVFWSFSWPASSLASCSLLSDLISCVSFPCFFFFHWI